MSNSTYVTETPVFRPTKEEFSKPFCEYMKKVLKKHPDIPMFKVVPPEGWRPRRTPFPKLQKLEIQCPIKQMVFGTRGSYRCILVEQKPLTAFEFRDIAEEEERLPPHKERDKDKDDALLERAFWSSVTINPPLYGADTPMSFFDEKLPYGWNLRDLGCLLKQPHIPQVPGVTTPMTYFGMWKSFFAWHVEDADLFSINYLHFGAPKVWYCVSPAHRAKFERMAQSLFPELHKHCRAFMRHKDILLSPSLLRTYGIEYMQAKQEPNEFIVLNAGAYHSGYNLGFNCAEAVNFATQEWIEVGRNVDRCKCDAMDDGVRISMRLFGCSSSSDDYTSTDGSQETGSGEASEEVDSSGSRGQSDQEASDEEEEQEEQRTPSQRRRRPSGKAAAAAAAAKEEKAAAAGSKRRGPAAAAAAAAAASPVAGSATKRSRSAAAAALESPSPAKGPRQTKTSLAAAAAAAKMRRTHATAEARARLAVAHGRTSKRGSGGSSSGSKQRGGSSGSGRSGRRKERRARPVKVVSKDTDTLADSLQRAAAAAAAIRARAEAEAVAAAAAAAGQQQQAGLEQQQPAAAAAADTTAEDQPSPAAAAPAALVKQDSAAAAVAGAVLTRRRSSSTGGAALANAAAAAAAAGDGPGAAAAAAAAAAAGDGPAAADGAVAAAAAAAAAGAAAPDSPRASKAVMAAGGRVSEDGGLRGEAPQVIIGEERGHKYFYMVQVLRDAKPKQRGRLVMRWLKEGRDGLFRPSSDTWEDVPGSLVGVRTQWVAGAGGRAGGYRLLTLRSRILETELVD